DPAAARDDEQRGHEGRQEEGPPPQRPRRREVRGVRLAGPPRRRDERHDRPAGEQRDEHPVDHHRLPHPTVRFCTAPHGRDRVCRYFWRMAVSDASSAAPGGAAEERPLVEKLVAQVKRQGDFPAVSQFVTETLAAVRSVHTPTHRIANLILKDLSLTNAIL